MKIEIDTQELLQQIKDGKALGGKDGALTPLIKQLTEAAFQGELESHLAQDLQQTSLLCCPPQDAMLKLGIVHT